MIVETIATVYNLPMAKYINVQVKDVEKPIRVEGDSVEQFGNVYQVKKQTVIVAQILATEFVAWWEEHTPDAN
jgi:hypothetical protein